MTQSNYNPPSPDSVRVWRGFRLPTLSLDDFCKKLGGVFVPATVKMQIDAGLQAYSPSVPAGLPGKPDKVPDETAILFWESQQTYWNGFSTLAVRTYTLTHGGVYINRVDPQKPRPQESGADFPVAFAGTLLPEQPVFLFTKPVDWMHGTVIHLLGSRPAEQDPAAFKTAVATALAQIQKTVPLNGAIACAGDDYLVYWELRAPVPNGPNPPSGVSLLQPLLAWKHVLTPAPTFLPIGLWETWAGMDVQSGSSFNMQFERREQP